MKSCGERERERERERGEVVVSLQQRCKITPHIVTILLHSVSDNGLVCCFNDSNTAELPAAGNHP